MVFIHINNSDLPIMKYSLRQLEVFLATARAETLSHAAQELAMSQSAASDALAGLEQQFDVRLFDRIGKRLQLNETGRSLLPAVEELLVRARELERVLGRKDTAGSLAVGATLSIGNYLAVPIMLRYMHENPGARVTLDVANTATIGAEDRTLRTRRRADRGRDPPSGSGAGPVA
jgi:DNA-binding transcriptional LysR family regulator